MPAVCAYGSTKTLDSVRCESGLRTTAGAGGLYAWHPTAFRPCVSVCSNFSETLICGPIPDGYPNAVRSHCPVAGVGVKCCRHSAVCVTSSSGRTAHKSMTSHKSMATPPSSPPLPSPLPTPPCPCTHTHHRYGMQLCADGTTKCIRPCPSPPLPPAPPPSGERLQVPALPDSSFPCTTAREWGQAQLAAPAAHLNVFIITPNLTDPLFRPPAHLSGLPVQSPPVHHPPHPLGP